VDNIFLDTFFDSAKTAGQALLATAIVAQPKDTSTLQMSDLNFAVTPYQATNGKAIIAPSLLEQSLNTLNYLCAISNDSLPNPEPFTWNWVDQSQVQGGATPPDGDVALNRNLLQVILRLC